MQYTGYVPSGNFVPLDLNAVKNIQPPANSMPADGSTLFIRPLNHDKTSAQENLNPLDALKTLEKVVQKAEKQNALFKGIKKIVPLDLVEPKPVILNSNFVSYIAWLKEYQEKAVNYLIEFKTANGFYPPLGWEMGTGKTYTFMSLILNLIAKGEEKFLITAPSNVVNQHYKAFQKQLWATQAGIIQSFQQDLDPDSGTYKILKNEIDTYFKNVLFDPLKRFFEAKDFESKNLNKKYILPALQNYCRYYIQGEPEKDLSEILSDDKKRNKLYQFCYASAKNVASACFKNEEGKKTFAAFAKMLKLELKQFVDDENFNNLISPLLQSQNLEQFEKAYQTLTKQSADKIYGALFYALIRLAEVGKMDSYLPLKWDSDEQQKQHLNLLHYPVKKIVSAVATQEYKENNKNKNQLIEIIGHEAAKNKIKLDKQDYGLVVVDEAQNFHTTGNGSEKWLTHVSQLCPVLPVSGTLFENHFDEVNQLISYGNPDFIGEQKNVLKKWLESSLKILSNAIREKTKDLEKNKDINLRKNKRKKIEEKDENFEIIKIAFCYFNQFANALKRSVMTMEMSDPRVLKAWHKVPTKITEEITSKIFSAAKVLVDELDKKEGVRTF